MVDFEMVWNSQLETIFPFKENRTIDEQSPKNRVRDVT